ncbi:MAG: hypothetical protein PHU80_05600 [Kiritimatiellae bacterium]|nr:hypothetical protein [Kiritimatiellia bacterium]
MRQTRVMALAAAVLSAATLWAQGLVICPACGREAEEGAAVCGHCKKELSKPVAEQPKSVTADEPDKDAEMAAMAVAAVDSSAVQARGLEERSPDVALHFYLNAMALMRLVPEGAVRPGVGEALLAGRVRVMQTLARGRDQCRRCGGSGRYQVNLGKVDGTSGVRAASGVACPECKGLGGHAGHREIDQFKMAILQGREGFERSRMVAGDVRVGRSFMPAALEARLSNRQRALVMTGMPVPCAACQLTARQACRACRGTGWVKCDNSGCRQGVLQPERRSGVRPERRLNEEQERRCPRCKGLGEVKCGVCQGSKGVVCEKCGGSGLGARCQRCTGSGLMTCTKCRGTGEVKGAPCSECKGEGVILCTTCRGEGALAR